MGGERLPISLQGFGAAWGLRWGLLAARAAEVAVVFEVAGVGFGGDGPDLGSAEWGRDGGGSEAGAEHVCRSSLHRHDVFLLN